MGGPLRKLLELVREPGGPSEGRLRVISVVGFHGLGKTLLAHQVFDQGDVRRLFPLRDWVCAAGKGTPEVLKEMLHQLLQNGAGTSADGARQVDSAPVATMTTSDSNCVIPEVEKNGVEQVQNGENTSAGVTHGVGTWRRCLQAVWWALATILLYILSPAFTVANMVRASSLQVESADIHSATANVSISSSTKIVAQVDENKSVQMKKKADRGKAIQEDTHEDGVDDTTLIKQSRIIPEE